MHCFRPPLTADALLTQQCQLFHSYSQMIPTLYRKIVKHCTQACAPCTDVLALLRRLQTMTSTTGIFELTLFTLPTDAQVQF